ncbi:hypothetical protein [Haloarchaeobius sp. HRN-SO-5]|uniref:hypothetical protein n=1 Tax=Haloarchaeobius sp. HRN-SO-5 TaxID=3446118 RepID=UPI003EB6DEB5
MTISVTDADVMRSKKALSVFAAMLLVVSVAVPAAAAAASTAQTPNDAPALDLGPNENASEQAQTSSEDASNEFAENLNDYIESVQNGDVSEPGLEIAEWVHSHVPADLPEQAGADGETGQPDDTGSDNAQSPPENAGDDDDDEDIKTSR